jgi:hypothetical protein
MAKYSDIKGFTVQTLSTDTIANAAAGGTWASSPSANQARAYLQGFGASYTAAGAVGGANPGNGPRAETELWNGSSWTEVNDMPAGMQDLASAGTTTAAFAAGGLQPHPTATATNYEWDGTNWTGGGSLNLARYDLAGAGTLTAGMVAGGQTVSPSAARADYRNLQWLKLDRNN